MINYINILETAFWKVLYNLMQYRGINNFIN